jgi:hypothetical protein
MIIPPTSLHMVTCGKVLHVLMVLSGILCQRVWDGVAKGWVLGCTAWFNCDD